MRRFAFQKRSMVIIAGMSACVLIIAVFLYLPLVRAISKEGSEWRNLNQVLNEAGENLSVFRGASGGKKIIAEDGISSVIDIIVREGKNNILDFKSIIQENIRNIDGNRRILPVAIEMEGDYKQAGIFFGALENIKDALVTVERFSIKGDEKTRPRVSVSIVLNIHLTKG